MTKTALGHEKHQHLDFSHDSKSPWCIRQKDNVYASIPGQTSVSISMRVNPSTIGDWFFSQDMGTKDETKLQLRGLGPKLFQIIKDYQTTELCEKSCKGCQDETWENERQTKPFPELWFCRIKITADAKARKKIEASPAFKKFKGP